MANLTFDFTLRTVLVTGAGQGIGKEVASLFVRSGADVFLVDVDAQTLDQATDELGAHGLVADVSDTEAVEAAVQAVVATTGRLDILVNNAGILRDKVLWKLTDEDYEIVLAVHAGGTFRMTRAAVPHFRAQGFGRVINVTSYTGLHGNRGQANYAMAKAGIIGFTKTAAKELAGFGVTVNAISPNAETRMFATVPDERRAELTAILAAGRIAPPGEISATVAFLASDEAGYITGTVLAVDGGMSM